MFSNRAVFAAFFFAVASCDWAVANGGDFNTTTMSVPTTTTTTTGATPVAVATPFADLKKSLLDDYDPQARPGTPDEPITVSLGMMLNTVQVEEWNVAVHADAFLIITWTDNRLTWDPSEHSGIESLKLSPVSVWLPDISLYNEIPTFSTGLQAIQKNVYVMSNGTVLFVPSLSLKATCALDMIRFPHDRQRCQLIFGSWTYDKSEIDLKLLDEPIKKDTLVTTSPWRLAFSYAKVQDDHYPGIAGTWPSARFVFYLHRRITPYCISLYTPVFACVLASISTFLLWRKLCGTVLILITLMKTAILTGVVAHHALSLRVSECGVPCVMKFIGSLIALEALVLPLKAILANLMADVRGWSDKTAKPLPRSLNALVALPTVFRRKGKGGDEAALLTSEVEQKNLEDWASARFLLGMLVMSVYMLGLAILSLTFLMPLVTPYDDDDQIGATAHP